MGIALAAFYWVPVVGETKYTLQPMFNKTVIFWPLATYLFSAWRYGWQFQGHNGELIFPVGYMQITLFLVSAYIIWKKRKFSPGKFWAITAAGLFLFMQSWAKPIWLALPLISNLQFSYRLMAIICFAVAIAIGYGTSQLEKRKTTLLLATAMAILTSISMWNTRNMLPNISDQVLAQQLPESTANGEGLQPAASKWMSVDKPYMATRPKSSIEILSGTGEAKQISRTTEKHVYQINAATNLAIKENTAYFPGWTAKVDGKLTTINYESTANRGIMLIDVPQGTHQLELLFEDTPIRKASEAVSLAALMILVAAMWLGKNRRLAVS